MDIKNKYYVGANKAIEDIHQYGVRQGKTWAVETEEEAVEQAKTILKDNPKQEYAFVVKVVKVIRRPDTPLIIESIE